MNVPVQVLTELQIDELRGELQRSLNRLERSVRHNGNGASREIDQSAVGRLSRIEALQNQHLVQNLHERERQHLAEVLDALRRIEDGSYGLCTGCRTSIGFERLLVFPETRTCTGCTGAN